ncbi:MAG: PAS domain S-box protein [Treponema sp.]|nr:PAS domain S-box protein [Treponema sp.]
MDGYVNRVIDMLPKLSDDEVQRIVKSICGRNTMLDSIIESLSTGLVIVDKSWKIIKRNKAANRYLFSNGIDETRIDSEPIWNLTNECEIADFLHKTAQDEKSNVGEEFSTTSSDGSVRFLSVSVMSFVLKSEIAGNIIKIDDVTRKRNQDILMRRMENMAGLTNLAAGMAHEIKNPLGAISIHIQLIQRAIKKAREGDGLLPDQKFLEDHLDVVNEEIDSLNKHVMDFLFAVRPVKAELSLRDPNTIIESLADFFTPEFNRSHVDVQLNLVKEKKRILIDEKLFREVLINISQNGFAAIKSKFIECSEEHSGNSCSLMPGKLIFGTFIADDKYIITVGDNGCGMDEETVSRIFEPYFTTKANGTGLGMTMAYKIIKEFGGEIQVQSHKGEGSVFSIILPVPQTDKKLLK